MFAVGTTFDRSTGTFVTVFFSPISALVGCAHLPYTTRRAHWTRRSDVQRRNELVAAQLLLLTVRVLRRNHPEPQVVDTEWVRGGGPSGTSFSTGWQPLRDVPLPIGRLVVDRPLLENLTASNPDQTSQVFYARPEGGQSNTAQAHRSALRNTRRGPRVARRSLHARRSEAEPR